MAITVELTPQEEECLRSEAERQGIEPEKIVERLVRDHVSSGNGANVDTRWMDRFPPTGRAAEYLRARLEAEATDDPEELRLAAEEIEEMKRSMSEERLRSGAEPIF